MHQLASAEKILCEEFCMDKFKKITSFILNIFVFVLVWFISFIVLVLLFGPEEGQDMSFAHAFFLILCPACVGVLAASPKLRNKIASYFDKTKFKKNKSKPVAKIQPKSTKQKTEEKLPVLQSKRIENVQRLVQGASSSYDFMLKTDSPILYVHSWNQISQTLDELEKYRGTVPDPHFYGAPSKHMLEKNFQWKLRDTMERAKVSAIVDISGEHRNNKNGRFLDLKKEFERFSDRYDQETINYALSVLKDVAAVAGISEFTFRDETVETILETRQPVKSSSLNPLVRIDLMEGHEFEHWCANLLSNIGYANVSVTQGSGDQGVDVLAEKDGVRYAIQCKCYSKDLGNSPVQEVVAGRKFYHCHLGAVITNQHFTKGAKELAAETGVLLWDRDWIAGALEKCSIDVDGLFR